MSDVNLKFVARAVEQIGGGAEKVLEILQAVQGEFGYLPVEALERVCELTEITPAAITGVSILRAARSASTARPAAIPLESASEPLATSRAANRFMTPFNAISVSPKDKIRTRISCLPSRKSLAWDAVCWPP